MKEWQEEGRKREERRKVEKRSKENIIPGAEWDMATLEDSHIL